MSHLVIGLWNDVGRLVITQLKGELEDVRQGQDTSHRVQHLHQHNRFLLVNKQLSRKLDVKFRYEVYKWGVVPLVAASVHAFPL